MNKKLKKALYMFGFALPIVAIPIITVACGTQTSQVEPIPTPAPEQQQPNKEPEIKKMEEVKPDLSVLKDKEITEEILSQNIKNLLSTWKENEGNNFKIVSFKSNPLYTKIVSSYIDDSNASVKLKNSLKYSDIYKAILNLNFVDVFDITKLNIVGLKENKLENIKLNDVFSSDSKKLIEEINKKNNEEFANVNSKYDENDKSIKKNIENLINTNSSGSFKKFLDDLKDTSFTSDKFKQTLMKLKFNELIDIDLLQEKLTYIKDLEK